jgi:FkbM family methyltransferase
MKYTKLEDIELIISANGCTDNTKRYIDYLISAFEFHGLKNNIKYFISQKPLGYAKATNAGIELATTDKVILLNNDTILLEQPKNQWLDMLEGPFLRDADVGISGPIIQHSPDAGRDFCVFFCAMIDKKVFERIGLLNEEYGVGSGEDVEFCVEAVNAGFKMAETNPKTLSNPEFYVGGFPIYHVGEGTVHDVELVQNWDTTFKNNLNKLANKYSDQKVKDSLAWLCNNGPEAIELYDEVICSNIYKVTTKNLKGRDVIDIGANMGTFSLFASKLGANKVIAVEPVSETVRVFKTNMQIANTSNIILKQNVVSDEAGKIVKMALQTKCGHNSAYTESEHYEEVPTITLKELLDLTNKENVFLKIDCEGGEYDVFMTATPEDVAPITTIAIEIHGDLHPKYQGVHTMQSKLVALGYKLIDRKQIGCWDGIDQYGRQINYRDLPLTNEIWSR